MPVLSVISIYLSIHLFLSICLSTCLSTYLPIYLFTYLSIYLSIVFVYTLFLTLLFSVLLYRDTLHSGHKVRALPYMRHSFSFLSPFILLLSLVETFYLSCPSSSSCSYCISTTVSIFLSRHFSIDLVNFYKKKIKV